MSASAKIPSGARVVVTGGAGFIGSEVVRQLVDAGCDVVAIDNLVNGTRANVEGLDNRHFRLDVHDIRDLDSVAKEVKNADVVFHLACLGVRNSIHSPKENNDVNATATLNLVALCKDLNAGRFIYISSSEVYGTAMTVPMTESHPAFPMTVYGAGKLAGECYARAYWETYRYPTVVVRPFNSFGPRSHHEGDSGEVVPKFMLRAMAGKPLIVFGDGSQTRDLTFVSDTARGILMAGFSEDAVGHTINIGTGHEFTISEIASEISALVAGGKAQTQHDAPRPGDVLRLCADIGKARALLGFAPKYSIREGLRLLHEWYLSSGKSPVDLLKEEVVHNWNAPQASHG